MSIRLCNAIFSFLELLGAGLWVGALVTFGFAVAPAVFRGLPSLTEAGALTAVTLHRINVLELGAAAMMVTSTFVFLLQPKQRSRVRLAKAAIAVLMTLLVLYYGTVIMDRLEYLRTVEIRDFDVVSDATRALRVEFDGLHDCYTLLAQANLWLGLGFLLLSGFEKT